ncbi:MAG TPA: cytidylate kinase-like family protein [bacterium]|nr:cytidylate kinase-like family protein [bacterium]HPN44227.1 cytidylate kinase-like family protein [bacterium]
MPANHNEQLNWNRLIKGQVAIWEVKQQIQKRQQKAGGADSLDHAIITISRTHGAGGDDVAEKIAEMLHWQIYDKELVEYIAQSGQLRNRIVAPFDERKQNQTHNFLQTMLDKDALGIDKYFHLLHAVIEAIAEQGRAIIIGRGANFIVDPKHSLRIMITAPLDYRVEKIAHARELPVKEAKKVVSLVDSNRFAFVQRYFHRSANDHTAYDLVLNMQHLTPQSAALIVINCLETKLGVGKEKQPARTIVIA